MFLKEPQDPLNIIITPLSRVPPFVALLIDIMARTFFPPVKCHWFLADIGRMIAEATRDFFDHCLNPVCRTTSTIRVRSLLNIILSTQSLSLAPEYRGILGKLPESLLRARLNAGVDWDIVDASLADVLKKTDREELARYSGDTVGSTVTASPNVSRLMLAPYVWRQRVYNLVQAIIEPEPLAWMDDDDATFIPDLCRRSLDEVQLRFKQYVILTFIWIHNSMLTNRLFCRTSFQLTPEARISLICKIAQLPCLLAQCDKTDCTTQSTNNSFLTVLPFLPVITHLLDGPEVEVTPDIRRRVYLALLPVLIHHNATEDLEPIVNVLQRGVNDLNRSVRVSAG